MGGLEVINWRVCIAKPLSRISKSQTWEFVFCKSKRERVHEFGLTCGCVSKLLLEIAIDLGLNFIVKTSILL